MSNPFFDHPIVNSPYECPHQQLGAGRVGPADRTPDGHAPSRGTRHAHPEAEEAAQAVTDAERALEKARLELEVV